MRFRPEIALTRLQLAELLLKHYPKERAEALEHLDFAIGEFHDTKMQPSLERALKHKGVLRAQLNPRAKLPLAFSPKPLSILLRIDLLCMPWGLDFRLSRQAQNVRVDQ